LFAAETLLFLINFSECR